MDNLDKEKYLSVEETEQLCRLYMECGLTRLEEVELQYVLGILPYSTPVIDEARVLMNISLSSQAGQNEGTSVKTEGKKKNITRRILMIAASIVLILSVGIPVFLHFRRHSDFYCQVFTNGKEVSRDKAIVIAEGELERIDRFFENMQTIESEQQQKTESF